MATPEKEHSPLSSSSEDVTAKKGNEGLLGGVTVDHILTAGQSQFNNHDATSEEVKRTKRIMRKLDLRVLPVASVLYLFSFLDRSAIGNARVAGMDIQLGLNDAQYRATVSVFFALYCLLEVPSNLMLKRYGAKMWLPFIVVIWGLFMLFTGFVTNFAGLLSLRLLLGGAEAGLFPGVTYYLTTLYPRRYIQTRIGIFFSAATIAGAFGGLLAYGLARVNTGNYSGWSWIFFVEGILTVCVGIGSYFILFNGFEEANFLSEEDKSFMKERIMYDSTDVPMDDSYSFQYVKDGLTDWKTYMNIITYICCITPLYSIALTLPTILRVSLGYDAIRSQLMTVPVYCVASVMVVVWATWSDWMHNRSLPLIAGCTISAIGWGVGLAYPTSGNVRYGAMFLSSFSYAAFPGNVALVSQNVAGKTKRSVAIAIQVGVGGLAGIISSNIFLTRDRPQYQLAYHLNLYFNCAAIAFAALNWFLLYLANQRKQKMIASGEAALISKEDLSKMGDRSPYFMYKY